MIRFDDVIKHSRKKLPMEFKTAFIAAVCAGLVAHMYMFTNKLPNFDDLGAINGFGVTFKNGRWFLWILGAAAYHLNLVFSLPWFNGLFTLTVLGISAGMIAMLLQIKSAAANAILGAALVVFPSWTSTFFYMFTTPYYAAAVLMSVVSVYLTAKCSKGFLGAIPLLALLEKSDVVINYVTSDPEDKVFEMESDRFRPYYIGENKLIVLMLKMEADIVVMTTPDLESFHIKRSLVRKDNEYIYVPHDVNSPNLTFRKEALDHFDTVFSSGYLCTEEIRKREELYGLPRKRIVEWGSGVIDNMIRAFGAMEERERTVREILIAPSWQKDNILSSCIGEILENLQGHGYKLIVRPHPQFVRHERERLEYLRARFDMDARADMELQTDFSSNRTVYEADLVITDWSSIAFEYSFATLKPSLFINTPMKIMNTDYEELGITPIDIELRSRIGRSVDMDQLASLPQVVEELLSSSDFSRASLAAIRDRYIYQIGHSGEAGAAYIMDRLAYYQKKHEEEDD